MPGIFGSVQSLPQTEATTLMEKMAAALEPEQRFRHEVYAEDGFGFGRASLGIANPEFQPQWNKTQTVALVMEGELYDTRGLIDGLAARGIELLTASQAELLLQLYLTYGEAFVEPLNGAFCAAIWDKRNQKLLIVNDRLGLHPVYYSQHSGGLVFASGVRAILADPRISRAVDRVAIQEFMTFDHVLGQRTLLEHVQLLPQASVLTFQNGSLSIRRYYDLRYPHIYPKREEPAYLDQFLFEMRRAVQRQSQDDPQPGLMLSGGMDSRMLLAVLGELGDPKRVHSFTWSIPGSDDARYAAEVASKIGSSHHFFELKPDWLLQQGEKAVRITDGMGNIVNLHAIATLEDEVAYSQTIYKGFLGDAMFGFGIRPRFWADYDPETMIQQHLEAYRDYDVLTYDLPDHPAIFTDSFLRQTSGGLMEDFTRGMHAAKARQMTAQRLYFDFTQRVPRMTINGVLVVRDRAEVRLPFADNDLVEFSASVPPWLHYERRLMTDAFIQAYPALARIPTPRNGLPMVKCARELMMRNQEFIKWHLRRVGLSKLAGPDSRPYKDYHTWFRTVLRRWVEDTLLSPRALERGYFQPEAVRGLVSGHMSGENQSVRIGALMALELWHRMYLDG